MISFKKKNIHKWESWRKRGKFSFCVASGAIYALAFFAGTFITKYLQGNLGEIISDSALMALFAWVVAGLLSTAVWQENERKYKEWKKEQDKDTDKK